MERIDERRDWRVVIQEMFIYYGRTFNSASIGLQLVEVACDQCGCRYFYELARVGSGTVDAPYAIGSARAERSARDKARRELDRRLAEEAELVPCPKCLWINDDMVAGYRRGRYRGATKVAAGLCLAGTCLTLVTAWFASLGPAGLDRDTFAFVLAVGLAGSIVIPGSILLLCRFLRQRIQPNSDHPFPQKLPPGSPTALILNEATGELEPAGQATRSTPEDRAWMNYQIGRSALPPICCSCLAPESTQFAFRRPVGQAVALVVPLCESCSRRWTRRKWLGALIALGATAAFGVPMMLALKLDEIVFWCIVLGLGFVLSIIGAMIADRGADPVRFKIVNGSRGVVRLWFRNADYLNDVPANQEPSR